MTTATLDRYIGFDWLGTPTASVAIADTRSDTWEPFLIPEYASHSTSTSSDAATLLMYLLDQDVVIKDIISAWEFLGNRLGLVSHLYDAPSKIRQYFEESSLELGIFSDPDDPEEKQELYIEITTPLSPKEANEKWSKINEEWIFASDEQSLMGLNITLKFS